MKNKLWNILLLVLCISLFFGCSDTETKSSFAPQKTTPAPSPTPVESAAYPVGEKTLLRIGSIRRKNVKKYWKRYFPKLFLPLDMRQIPKGICATMGRGIFSTTGRMEAME